MTQGRADRPRASVIFALVREGKVLCEWRHWKIGFMHSIPGGKIDPEDCIGPGDPRETALKREMMEELGLVPTRYEHIGDVPHPDEDWTFHVYLVTDWQGDVLEHSFEGGKPLNWVDPVDLGRPECMPEVADLVRERMHS